MRDTLEIEEGAAAHDANSGTNAAAQDNGKARVRHADEHPAGMVGCRAALDDATELVTWAAMLARHAGAHDLATRIDAVHDDVRDLAHAAGMRLRVWRRPPPLSWRTRGGVTA